MNVENPMQKPAEQAINNKQTKQYSVIYWFILILAAYSAVGINQANAKLTDNHPLVDKLWSVEKQQFVDKSYLKKSILESDHTIVGETHDNIQHHIIQANVLQWLIDEKENVSPVFEMLSKNQLESIQNLNITSADLFFDKVSWEESGWPDRKLYKPIFDVVIENKLPVYAAETDRKVLMEMIKNGESNLPSEIKKHLNAVKLIESAKNQFREEIIASHCGMLPEKMVDPMILGQRVRDAVMAKIMLHAGENAPTLLIAGSGHGRNDVGVPAYITSQNPKAKVTSIALMEVVDEVTEPTDYAEAWLSKELPFDFVWFTSRMERKDPCEELKQHFKKHPA